MTMRCAHVFVFVLLAACSGDDPSAPSPGANDASTPTGGGDSAIPPPNDAGADAPVKDSDADAGPDAAPIPCPAGLGFRWTCDGSARRVRCVDQALQAIACGDGCVAAIGGDDATCSCGASSNFTRQNCTADGDLHACPGGSIWTTRSCGGLGCVAGPLGTDDTCNAAAVPLQAVLDRLGGECGTFSPGTTCGITAKDFTTLATARFRGDAIYVSASSAKAIWVAAALYDTSIAQVQPLAGPIFTSSDNTAAGQAIDLLASPERVNTFMWNDAFLASSGFCHWNYDHARNASNCPSRASGDNFFTANDTLAFLTRIFDRSLLGVDRTTALLSWMTLSPRSGYGGWLGTQLPPSARATMHHKAGWLPPDVVPGYSNSNEIGIIDALNGHSYAISQLMSGATDYAGKQLPMMEYASCVVFHAVSGDVPDPFAVCTHP